MVLNYKSPYVKGVVGKTVKLTFKQKLQILFSKEVEINFHQI